MFTSACVRYCKQTSRGAKSGLLKSLRQGPLCERNDDSTHPRPKIQPSIGISFRGCINFQSGVTHSLENY